MKAMDGKKEKLRVRLSRRAKQLSRDIPAVFVALHRKETPKTAKILAVVTVAYALSPIDLIPDFIPVLGYLDDLIILPALVAATVKRIPPEILSDCRQEARGMWKNGKPKKWYFALPMVIFWLLVLFIILKAVLL